MGKWTYEESWRSAPKSTYRHYTIKCNGIIQPFGAIFYSRRGDSLRHVRAAIKQLNALAPDATSVTLAQPQGRAVTLRVGSDPSMPGLYRAPDSPVLATGTALPT